MFGKKKKESYTDHLLKWKTERIKKIYAKLNDGVFDDSPRIKELINQKSVFEIAHKDLDELLLPPIRGGERLDFGVFQDMVLLIENIIVCHLPHPGIPYDITIPGFVAKFAGKPRSKNPAPERSSVRD